MSTEELPAHSPLGASSAKRWLNCAGSVSLINRIEATVPERNEDDDPEWTREGKAMHDLAADCLINDADAWEVVGQERYKVVLDAAMGQAVQEYLNAARAIKAKCSAFFVEKKFHRPDIHPSFYGTADCGGVETDGVVIKHVHVMDLKGGVGIIVEPEENEQFQYYAFGVIDTYERAANLHIPDDTPVTLYVSQPRAYHHDGSLRTWTTTVGALRKWVEEVLVPGMEETQWSETLTPGEHCRFCPAKLVCPALSGLFRAACTTPPAIVTSMDDAALAREYANIAAAEKYVTAIKAEALSRLNTGREVQGLKLVHMKSNRTWRDDARDLLKGMADAWKTEPTQLSPAAYEKLGDAQAKFVKEHAYTPQGGLTVALEGDKRAGVKVEPASKTWQAVLDNAPGAP